LLDQPLGFGHSQTANGQFPDIGDEHRAIRLHGQLAVELRTRQNVQTQDVAHTHSVLGRIVAAALGRRTRCG